MATPPNILLIGSAPTVGDAAIGESIIAGLREQWPACRIRVLTPRIDQYEYLLRYYDLELRSTAETRAVESARNVLPPRWATHWRFLAAWGALVMGGPEWMVPRKWARATLDQLKWADLVVFQGGPRWVRLYPSLERYRLLFVTAAKRLGVPVVAIGQSIGPF
ncbi:MAG: polysaccharide pyruvyl transferase family protein, partial [Planctomycetaceae bacterium]|nr:polysaccharide pyruvyl transferase family protein [Planctomycetaceae bacterium]